MRRYTTCGLALLCVLVLGCAAGRKGGEAETRRRPPSGYIQTGTPVDKFTSEAADVYESFMGLETRFLAIAAKIDDIKAKYWGIGRAKATLKGKVEQVKSQAKEKAEEVKEAMTVTVQQVQENPLLLPAALRQRAEMLGQLRLRMPENEFKTLKRNVEKACSEAEELVTSAVDLLPGAASALTGFPTDPFKALKARKAVARAKAQLSYVKENGSELLDAGQMVLRALVSSPQ